MADKDGAVTPGIWSDIKWSLNEKGSKQIKEIIQLLRNSDRLILATDPDREGEAIAWHIYELLMEAKALEDVEVKRAVFHSITKGVVKEAIKDLKEIDGPKVRAYLARRILDHLVGFKISPLLWRRLPGARSAGRVQSVALKMICERENERECFDPQEYWTVETEFKIGEKTIKAQVNLIEGKTLKKFDIPSEKRAKDILKLTEESSFLISETKEKPSIRKPQPPFITSTLTQEAFRKLNFTAQETMKIAQELFAPKETVDEGYITYMRTDNPDIVDGQEVSKIRFEINERYGQEYSPKTPIKYKSTSAQAQEGHGAIIPTDIRKQKCF